MKKFILAALTVAVLATNSYAQDADKDKAKKPAKYPWVKLFDGKTLSGWTAPDPGDWEVKNGVLHGKGNVSHLFSPNTYTNLEFKAQVRTQPNSNSGMYFRAEKGQGWPKGYEAQVNNTYKDPQKTGGLYNFHKVLESPTKDNEWWTQHIIAIGNRIIIKVNDKIVTDFVDEKNTFKSGHVAFQQHDPGSHVEYKNVMVKALPADEKAAWKIVKKGMPELDVEPKK